jgi:hypothetical protein
MDLFCGYLPSARMPVLSAKPDPELMWGPHACLSAKPDPKLMWGSWCFVRVLRKRGPVLVQLVEDLSFEVRDVVGGHYSAGMHARTPEAEQSITSLPVAEFKHDDEARIEHINSCFINGYFISLDL